jgi:aryl-alcohol dehydrogenase-like predicted oxidoreductase
MRYASLGRTGLSVSRICLGTMNFGWLTEESASHAIMDRALEAGVNFFDTANRYGHVPGATEEILGRWFALGGGRREKVVLATKVYGSMGDWPNERGLSALNIRRACEASLRRLRTDYVDLYQMHHVDRSTPWDEIWQAMQQLVREGKVLYVGSSNFAGWHIVQANEAARARHFLGLVSEQSLYNLLQRTVELEVLPACCAYGVGLIAWSPLSGGLLAGGTATAEHGRRAIERERGRLGRNEAALSAFDSLCRELEREPSVVALAWLLAQEGVTAPIVGARTIDQLERALEVPELDLDDETLRRLDELFPGPGGPAPEAYAW